MSPFFINRTSVPAIFSAIFDGLAPHAQKIINIIMEVSSYFSINMQFYQLKDPSPSISSLIFNESDTYYNIEIVVVKMVNPAALTQII
jgi:hypothetical protein